MQCRLSAGKNDFISNDEQPKTRSKSKSKEDNKKNKNPTVIHFYLNDFINKYFFYYFIAILVLLQTQHFFSSKIASWMGQH